MPSQGHSPHQASFSQTRNTPINLAEPSPSQGFRETTQIGEAKTLALQCFLSSYSCWNTRECLLYTRPVQTSSPRAGSHFQGHCALTIRILSSDTSTEGLLVASYIKISRASAGSRTHTALASGAEWQLCRPTPSWLHFSPPPARPGLPPPFQPFPCVHWHLQPSYSECRQQS